MRILTKFIINLMLLIVSAQSYATIPASERDALIELYRSTNGENWINHTNWLGSPGTECSWFGIACDQEEFHVESIDLNSNNLIGKIPDTLNRLTNLTSLVLFTNQLSGSIPGSLGQLSHLTFIELRQNQLNGTIPPELGQLSELFDLSFRDNQLTGTIPDQLSQLSQLSQLDLGKNQISGQIPASLSSLTNLRCLSLDSNSISGSIPSKLGQMVKLECLHLSNNQLSGEIPPELGQLSKIGALGLEHNLLSGSIPVQLGQLTALTYLTLNHNLLSGSIPNTFLQLSNIPDFSVNGVARLMLESNECLSTLDATLISFLNKKDPSWQTQNNCIASPLASFTATPTQGNSPLTVNLDASASSSKNGSISGYEWSSSDGQTASGKLASLIFNTPGSYTITLTVTDTSNKSASDSQTISVTDASGSGTGTDTGVTALPVAAFTASPAQGSAPLVVNLDASTASAPGGSIVDYAWSSNDGQQANGKTVSLTYPTPGYYIVTLAVTDANAKVDRISKQIIVASATANDAIPPLAAFSASTVQGNGALTVNLDASASADSTGTISSYAWLASDGQVASGKQASLTFNKPESLSIQLTVTNNSGKSASSSQKVALFNANPAQGMYPLSINLELSDKTASDGNLIQYAWTSEPEPVVTSKAKMSPKSSATPETTGNLSSLFFDQPGNFIITLTAKDAKGNVSTTQQKVVVADAPLTAQNPLGLLVNIPAKERTLETDRADWYEFYGQKDHAYQLRMDVGELVDPLVEIYDAAGTLIGSVTTSIGKGILVQGVLPADGHYKIRVANKNPKTVKSVGNVNSPYGYILEVLLVNSADAAQGKIINSCTGNPVSAVQISLANNSGIYTESLLDGEFSLPFDAKSIKTKQPRSVGRIIFERPDFDAQEFALDTEKGTKNIDIRLTPRNGCETAKAKAIFNCATQFYSDKFYNPREYYEAQRYIRDYVSGWSLIIYKDDVSFAYKDPLMQDYDAQYPLDLINDLHCKSKGGGY